MNSHAKIARHARPANSRGVAAKLSLAFVLLAFFMPARLLAQGVAVSPPPVRSSVDANGVDLISGALVVSTPQLSIGQGEGALVYTRYLTPSGWLDNMTGTINIPTGQSVCTTSGVTTVSFGGASEAFTWSGGASVNAQGGGSTLACNTSTHQYTYTTADGVVVLFGQFAAFSPAYANGGRAIKATWPDGMVMNYTYNTATAGGVSASRLQSVNNNLGYQLKFTYQLDSPLTLADLTPWTTIASVTGINNAVEYCSPSASTCTLANSWPQVTYAAGSTAQNIVVHDPLGNPSTFTYDTTAPNGNLVGIQRPGSPTGGNTTSIYYNASSQVASISNSARVVGPSGSGAGTWFYAYSAISGVETTTVTDPNGHVRKVVANLATGEVTSDTIDPGSAPHLNLVTSYFYDNPYGRLTEIDLPAGDKWKFFYDQGTGVRGNVTQAQHVAVGGSPTISTSAAFDAACGQPSKCNKPNTTTDALGNLTSYAYSPTTGQLTDIQLPAPALVPPETQLSYSSLNPWYIQAQGGGVIQGPNSISVLTSTSTCQNNAQPSCQHTSDEVVNAFGYDVSPAPPAQGNNLNVTSATTRAGDSSLTATVSQVFDKYGNVATTTGPLGAAQTSVFCYDLNRDLLTATGPLAAGQSTYPVRAYAWSVNGQVTQITKARTSSQGACPPTLTVLVQQNIVYDALGRMAQASLVSGGVTQTLSQWTYDNANRLICAATRMNPAAFASPPPSACVLGASGAYGSDRITFNAYDAADRLTSTTLGYQSAQPTIYSTLTYTPNGAVKTVADASNNLTTLFYDGFQRLTKIEYPKPTTPGQSDPGGYEGYTLDDNGNVTIDHRRNDDTITLTYDALNRVIQKQFSANTAWNVDYCYDLLGRLKTAQLTTTPNLCGTIASATVAYAWDALGRATTETTAGRTLAYGYDAAGDRTSITWPDSVAISYDYDVLQRAHHVLLGQYTLAFYGYDSWGRRTSTTRANSGGAPTSYAYDGAERLQTLTQSLTGTGAVTYTLGYDPAGGLVSDQVSNSAYLFHGPPTGQPTLYQSDGLDRYTSVGGGTPIYDGRQNLYNLSSASPHYTYDTENNLITASNPAMTLTRDALGRIQTKTFSGATETFLFSGSMLVGEYDASGNVLARYVPGPGTDEAVVWYAGAGTTTPQWLHADPLGSTIAWSNAAGGSLGTQAYDPFGQPAAWSGSRFAYTGQLMLGEAQLYDYKARAYSPALGRFMQTDPAGYASDVNPYAYVGNDPLDGTDPSGMGDCPDTSVPTAPEAGEPGTTRASGLISCGTGGGYAAGGGAGGSSGGHSGEGNGGLFKFVKQAICVFVPSGKIVSVSGSLGKVAVAPVSGSLVQNLKTGQVSGFAAYGAQGGVNGNGYSVAATGGYIWGPLNGSNSNYSNGSVQFNGGFRYYAGSASYSPSSHTVTLQVGIGKSVGIVNANVAAMNTSQPAQLGKLPPLGIIDSLLKLANQVCR